MNCPKCKHQLCLRNNSLKPKYIKVLKGRCAIEMLFDNLGKMEEWLAANHLDINPDGLPVVLELPRKRTLASTNSLLAPKLVCCTLKVFKSINVVSNILVSNNIVASIIDLSFLPRIGSEILDNVET